jgi:hypothetical protein
MAYKIRWKKTGRSVKSSMNVNVVVFNFHSG